MNIERKHKIKSIRRYGGDIKLYIEDQSIKTEGGCWEWPARYLKRKHEYPKVAIKGKTKSLAREVYRVYKGEPKENCVCHTCDNPKCVNPDHLFLGSHRENFKDAVNKGRRPRILKEDEVIQLKRLYKLGYGTRKLSREFGIKRKSVIQIIKGKSWKDVGDDVSKVDSKSRCQSKLTANSITKIKFMLLLGCTQTYLANIYGVSRRTIYEIKKRAKI